MVSFDWSNIEAIGYTFRTDPTSKYARLQQLFKEEHSDELSDVELADMFTTDDDGTKSLIPDAVTFLRMKICETFLNELNIGNDDERETMQNHIAVLMTEATFKGTRKNGSHVTVRDVSKLNRLADQAYSRGETTLELELSIPKWCFRRNWRPGEFLKIYIVNHETPSDDEEDNIGGNENEEDESLRSTTANINRESLNDRLAAALETIAQLAQANSATQVTQATRELPQDMNWNSNALPNGIRQRHDMCDQYLTSEQMGPFKIKNTDAAGNVSTVNANYYLHFDGGLQKLITRDGDCFDFAPIKDNKAMAKLFMAEFPVLQSDSAAHVRKWYREIISHAHPHHVYIHPYFTFRRDANHNRGFTIGDDFPNDLPKRYAEAINNWGSLIYRSLCKEKVIPDSCKAMKAMVRNYESGRGYEALWGLIKRTHPNHLRPWETNELVQAYPQQEDDEGLEHYFFRFQDHLRLKSFLGKAAHSLDDPQGISSLIGGCINRAELKTRTDFERGSPEQHQKDRYKSGNILDTLQSFESEIAFEKQHLRDRPRRTVPSTVSRRSTRFSKPSKYSSNKSAMTATSSLSSITQQSVNLIDSVGFPEDDPEVHHDIWDAYICAVETLERNPREFDISRKCLVCGETGHAFANCPALNNSESLQAHRIEIGKFLRNLRALSQKEIEARQKRISQLMATTIDSSGSTSSRNLFPARNSGSIGYRGKSFMYQPETPIARLQALQFFQALSNPVDSSNRWFETGQCSHSSRIRISTSASTEFPWLYQDLEEDSPYANCATSSEFAMKTDSEFQQACQDAARKEINYYRFDVYKVLADLQNQAIDAHNPDDTLDYVDDSVPKPPVSFDVDRFFHNVVEKQIPIYSIKARTAKLLWHQRLGHPCDAYLYNAHKFIDGVPKFARQTPVLDQCPTCIQCKQTKIPPSKHTTRVAKQPYQGLSIDFAFSGVKSGNSD